MSTTATRPEDEAGPEPAMAGSVGRYLGSRLLDDGQVLARLMLAGSLLGVLTTGVLARLAMRLLAVVNGDVRGVRSDDGFFIGEPSMSGSLELVVTGVLLGALSGLLYAALSPLQTGPDWFRTLSISVGAGVVVGAMLVHTDGVDFTFLDPAWLAVGMFVLIPVVHVALLDVVGRRIKSGELMRHRLWAVAGAAPLLLLSPFVAAVAAVRVVLLLVLRDTGGAAPLPAPGWATAARLVLTVIFVAGLVDLVRDVVRIS
ncbi:MAG TPA: hypothetical protein VFK34_03905 [Marmoricola sp.]|jgi:hypothetical protein|nr:hypothetical protein [Marmoricola sp.]